MDNEEWKGYINDLAEGIPTPEQIQQRKFREENLQNCYRTEKFFYERLNLKDIKIEPQKSSTNKYIAILISNADKGNKRIDIPFDDIETDMEIGKTFEEAVADNFINALLYYPEYIK